jgi:hypothetical protein
VIRDPLDSLVERRLTGIDFATFYGTSSEGSAITLTFDDGRSLEIWALGGIEGSASLEAYIEPAPQEDTDD